MDSGRFYLQALVDNVVMNVGALPSQDLAFKSSDYMPGSMSGS